LRLKFNIDYHFPNDLFYDSAHSVTSRENTSFLFPPLPRR